MHKIDMISKSLIKVLLLAFSVVVAVACGDDNTKEIYPIRFDRNIFEIRVNHSEQISFVDGSGDYTIKVENPDLLEASINTDASNLILVAKQKGETNLTVIDNIADDEVCLTVKITDSYLGFVCVSSQLPSFPQGTDIFLINNGQKDFYLFNQDKGSVFPVGEPLLKGKYETVNDNNTPFLILTYQNDKDKLQTQKFNIQDSDPLIFNIMNSFLNTGWAVKPSGTTREVGPKVYIMSLKEESTGHGASWKADTMLMPFGTLK